MLHLFDRRSKVAPAQYPRLPFHAIRLLQLVSSVIVASIVLFFVWHLTHEGWSTPWTFIFLISASLATIAVLAFTIVLHCLTGLHPNLNLVLNGFLTVLWGLSWSLLTWYMSKTLQNECGIGQWNEDAGIMICRLYKTLFTFSLTGLVSTVAALALDVYVYRHQTSRGVYRLHDLDLKSQSRAEATRGPFTDNTSYGDGGPIAERRESGIWDERPASNNLYDGPDGMQRLQQYNYDNACWPIQP